VNASCLSGARPGGQAKNAFLRAAPLSRSTELNYLWGASGFFGPAILVGGFRVGFPLSRIHSRLSASSRRASPQGLLRDGHRYRVRMPLMDHDSPHRTTLRPHITDGNGNCDEFAFSRPGYHILVDAAARDAREAAHREYLDYITNASKEPQRARDQDTPAGEPGLVGHDEPTHFSRPRITDGNGNCDEFAFSRPGYRMLADASVNDAREIAYAEYLDDLTNAWRHGTGKDVVPDAPKVSGNDATPVDDIETAYRLYSEEISRAWKTLR
jgi:hypothetical protein